MTSGTVRGGWDLGLSRNTWQFKVCGVLCPSPGKAPEGQVCFALVMHLESGWQQGIFHINV